MFALRTLIVKLVQNARTKKKASYNDSRLPRAYRRNPRARERVIVAAQLITINIHTISIWNFTR